MEIFCRHRQNLSERGTRRSAAAGGSMRMARTCGYRRPLAAFAGLLLALSAAAAGRAQPSSDTPVTAPILRLNTGGHTAPIWRVATDREGRYAVTASQDKTARVWSLPDGKLLSVIRVPIDDGNTGQLYAVAMTPDGATVALGGWTTPAGAQERIYLFD